MYTVHSCYFGTGEGVTYAVTFTKSQRKEDALGQFVQDHGYFLGQTAEAVPGLFFDFEGAELLLSEPLKAALLKWADRKDGPGGFHYKAEIHMNFS